PASVPFAAMSSVGNNSRFLRMRTIILTALITYGCGERAPTPTEPASASHREQAPLLGAPGPGGATSGPIGATSGRASQGDRRAAIDDALLAKLLRDADAHGAVLVTDVATGAVVASAAVGRDASAQLLPLSVIKLYLAALWWQHDRGDGDFLYRGRHVTVDDVLIDGWDRPGEEMAIDLRSTLTPQAMLSQLRTYGVGPGLSLPPDADDTRWGSTLSIGEHDVLVTL